MRTLEKLKEELNWCEAKKASLPSFLGSHEKVWDERIKGVSELIDAIQTANYMIKEGHIQQEDIENLSESELIKFVKDQEGRGDAAAYAAMEE